MGGARGGLLGCRGRAFSKPWDRVSGRLPLFGAAALALLASPAPAQPPALPAGPVADPFAWLEPQHGPAAVAWARAQTDETVAQLKASPSYPEVEAELKSALKTDAPLPNLFLIGHRFVRFVRDDAHPQGLLQTAAAMPGHAPTQWRTVLDLAMLNEAEHTSYALNGLSFFDFAHRCLPPAYDRCLLPLSPRGSSSLELREFDLARGTFVEGGFHLPANRAMSAWLDQDTLVVAHSLEGSRALPSSFPAVVRLWKRGTPLSAARPVFEADPTDSLVSFEAIGERADRAIVIKAVRDYLTVDYKLLDHAGALRDLPLPRRTKYVGDAGLVWPYVAVQLAEPAHLEGHDYPAEAIVAYDVRTTTPQGHRVSPVFVPSPGTYVTDGLTADRQGVLFTRTEALRKTLVVSTPGPHGWTQRSLLSAPTGETLSVISPDEARAELLVREEGFLTPATIRWLRPGAEAVTVVASQPIIDPAAFTVDMRTARSKDGTSVDYYLVRPRAPRSGPVPTLMGGYGSFGVNYDPSYFSSEMGRAMVSWLKRGGAFAATAIRGGGEKGAAWQRAGAALNKQNSYDDFIAVGEDLVRTGFTTPQHLGAFGRSGGGMLTAVMATQRPDLFGAIYVGVPVTDLAQMSASASGIVRGQKSEFGDWDDPEAFRRMMLYSPYQNIHPGVRYPPVLVVTSTEDNQVGPSHARKFAARLEAVGAKPLFIEDPEGGHGAPDPIKRPDLAAAQMVFFIDRLMP